MSLIIGALLITGSPDGSCGSQGTAHRISTSHASFEALKKYLEGAGYVDGEDFNSIKGKGQERIELYESGGVIQFRTRTSSGGLGEGFDLLVIDEAQEYTTEQESALKYTVTDSDKDRKSTR